MTTGLIFGLLAALAWGLGDTVTALLGRRIGSILTVAGIQLVSVTVLGGILLISGTALPVEPRILLPVVGIGVLASVSYVVFVEALRLGPVTIVSPVVAAYGGGTALLAAVVLGEQLGLFHIIGVAITTMGVVLTSLVFDRSTRSTRVGGPGVPLAVVALVTFAVVTVATSWSIREAGWLPVAFIARFVNNGLVWSFIGGRRLLRSRRRATTGDTVEGAADTVESSADVVDALLAAEGAAISGGLPATHLDDGGSPGRLRMAGGSGLLAGTGGILVMLLFSGLCDVGGYMAFAFGLEASLAWLVGLASSLGPIVVVTVGILVFGERPRVNQYIGFACVLAGLVVLARA